MTLDVNKPPLSRGNRCSNSANIIQRFTTYAVALHWQGWFFFYKKSHKRMVVWSGTHAIGFNQGKFARMKNSKHWEWWFRKLALAVKCRQLLPDRKQSVYFLNQVEGRELARNWKIYETGTKNDQLVMQCLKYKSSRLVLQAYGRQYRYWGRRPESGIIVHGDESTHIKKKTFPLPVSSYNSCIADVVSLSHVFLLPSTYIIPSTEIEMPRIHISWTTISKYFRPECDSYLPEQDLIFRISANVRRQYV